MIRSTLIACALFYATQASAQKSADTMRIGMAGSLSMLSTYHDSTPASHFLSDALFDTLIAYDERTNTYQPLIATRWTRTDDRTLEFEIRTDAKWHDGTAVDVDDVVYTLDWLSDPETRLHLEHQWNWIDHVEKLGRTKLRLIAKSPAPHALARLARQIPILPEHKHGVLLGERSYFGRYPVGSGPYKFVSSEHGTAAVTRVDSYAHGGVVKSLPKIRNIQVTGGWVYDNRLADWHAGKYDLLLDADPDLARTLTADGAAQLSVISSYASFMLAFDTRDTARPEADGRVRKALALALDLDAIARALPSGGRLPAALCSPEQAGCGTASATPKQDIAAARVLLKDYGRPVAMVLTAQSPSAAFIAERVAKAWRALGVTARVETVSPETFYMRVRDTQLDAAVFPWHGGSMPDVYDSVQTFFAEGFWDLHGDAALHKLAAEANTTMDDAARRGLVAGALARSADQTYALAIAPAPALAVHRPEVAIDTRGRWATAGFTVFDLAWR